jgi:predicted nucleic acid-binding protein
VIVDASVVLRAFLPDERQAQAQALMRDHVSGRIRLVAPTLLLYEITNAVLQGVRRGWITGEEGEAILNACEGLDIELQPVTWQMMLPLAVRFDRSAYDAAYLALAEANGEPLVTGDVRLYNAVRGELGWVELIGEF